jgi:hypothetical protein
VHIRDLRPRARRSRKRADRCNTKSQHLEANNGFKTEALSIFAIIVGLRVAVGDPACRCPTMDGQSNDGTSGSRKSRKRSKQDGFRAQHTGRDP